MRTTPTRNAEAEAAAGGGSGLQQPGPAQRPGAGREADQEEHEGCCRGVHGRPPPPADQSAVREDERQNGDRQSEAWDPGPGLQPADERCAGQYAGSREQRVGGHLARASADGLRQAEADQQPADGLAGAPGDHDQPEQWGGDPENHGPGFGLLGEQPGIRPVEGSQHRCG